MRGITSNTTLIQAEWSCIISRLHWGRQSRWYPAYAVRKGADNTWSATEMENPWGISPKASIKPDRTEPTPLPLWATRSSSSQVTTIIGLHWFSLTLQLYLFCCQAMAKSPQDLTRTSSSPLLGKQGRALFWRFALNVHSCPNIYVTWSKTAITKPVRPATCSFLDTK